MFSSLSFPSLVYREIKLDQGHRNWYAYEWVKLNRGYFYDHFDNPCLKGVSHEEDVKFLVDLSPLTAYQRDKSIL